ncbi:cucumber peeling cupredoxin [Gossypium hirsutum]|uniref:Cucumber peeling cupredoxin n=1 Tax=Gossypium hirsutum TaxID=3635 RepID=A0ABM3A996_GOSHI|nr:cucumber peeling cupredoxin-like [Gossypium hirsutum]
MADHRFSLSLVGLLMVAMAFLKGAIAADYEVGDGYGWDVPPSNSSEYYPSWANRYEFKVGDSAVFNWTGNHTAAQVRNQADYDNCNTNATEMTLYPIICTVGTHCEQGQKVAFDVIAADESSAPRATLFSLSMFLSAVAIIIQAVSIAETIVYAER